MSHPFAHSLALLTPYLAAYQPPEPPAPPEGWLPGARAEWRVDPLRLESEPFLALLHRLDQVTYGPLGLDMPRWALFDCGELPGVVAGFAIPAGQASSVLLELLGVEEDYTGLVPVSMAILLPQLHPGSWFCYSLCSANDAAPGAAPAQMRLLALAWALERLGVASLWTVNQWRSPNLYVFPRLGPLRLVCAFTPAHTHWHTLTTEVSLNRPAIQRLLAPPPQEAGQPLPPLLSVEPPPEGRWWLDCDDEAQLLALQARLEAGQSCWLDGPPRLAGDRTWFAILLDKNGPAAPGGQP